MNLSDATQTSHERAWLEDVFPVESLKQVQELLWVDFEPSDLDLDDEQFLDKCVAGFAGSGVKGKSSHSNRHGDARMNPKHQPEHLQPLMEWIAE